MRIKKVSQTTSTQAQVVDVYSTSTTDSYSCNYVNNINTYSTDEVRTGTWLGKPLYRKVLEMATPATANTWTDTGMLITGDFLGVGLGYVNAAANEQYPMNGQSDIYFYHNKNNGKLLIQCTDYYKSKEIKVAIEYTKTTD